MVLNVLNSIWFPHITFPLGIRFPLSSLVPRRWLTLALYRGYLDSRLQQARPGRWNKGLETMIKNGDQTLLENATSPY